MRKAIFTLTEAGAVLLVASQFLDLYHTKVLGTATTVAASSVGSNHAWGVLLLGILAAFFGVALALSGSRFGLLLVGLLGAISLVIALGHDLSAARSHGLSHVGASYDAVRNVVAIGLYVEIAGALVLVFTAVLGFLLGGEALTPLPRVSRPQKRPRRDTRGRRPPRRSGA